MGRERWEVVFTCGIACIEAFGWDVGPVGLAELGVLAHAYDFGGAVGGHGGWFGGDQWVGGRG